MANLFLISIFLLSARPGPAGSGGTGPTGPVWPVSRVLTMGPVCPVSRMARMAPEGAGAVVPESPVAALAQSHADQGIEGIVYPVSGNRMPAPNRKPVPGATAGGTTKSSAGGQAAGSSASPAGASSAEASMTPARASSGSLRGVKSTVYVFELTNISQVTRQGQTAYYVVVNTKLVKQADTDDTGYFKISLPPGRYSVFTRKGDLFYASRRDEKNNIAPVEVVEGKFTRFDCRIEGERKAVY